MPFPIVTDSPNATKLNVSLKLIIALGLGSALLSGCGIRGDLKTPPPVFGKSNVDPDRVPTGDIETTDDQSDEDFDIDLLQE